MKISALNEKVRSSKEEIESILDSALDSEHGVQVSTDNPENLRWRIYSFFRSHRRKNKEDIQVRDMYDDLAVLIKDKSVIITK